MSSVSLLFSTSPGFVPALIRLATWSRWSHVALIDGGTVIEALAPGGVRRVSIDAAIRAARRCEVVDIACADPALVLDVAASQIGKPYDYTAILGLGLHRDWQLGDAWFCSELIAWAFAAAGSPLFRREAMRRVTPESLWRVPPAEKETPLRFFSSLVEG